MTEPTTTRKFTNFPLITTNLIVINILIYLARTTFKVNFGFDFLSYFAVHDIRSDYFKIYQIITAPFINDNPFYFFLFILVLWMFGRVLENVWGARRFLWCYLFCQIISMLLFVTILYFRNNQLLEAPITTETLVNGIPIAEALISIDLHFIGAYGILFALLTAYMYLFPHNKLYVYFLFPLKAKWAGFLFIGLEIISYFTSEQPYEGILHITNLVGGILGFIFAFFWGQKAKINQSFQSV